jgi:hypothetical protein
MAAKVLRVCRSCSGVIECSSHPRVIDADGARAILTEVTAGFE